MGPRLYAARAARGRTISLRADASSLSDLHRFLLDEPFCCEFDGDYGDACAVVSAPAWVAFCPYCQVEHSWRVQDARLVEAIRPPNGLRKIVP